MNHRFHLNNSSEDADQGCDHREAPRCHRVLPARVLPAGSRRRQGNRVPPADRAGPQQVPLDVLRESRAELRLSLQGERRETGGAGGGMAARPTPVWCQAVLQVCDPTGSVRVVLWNSVCVRWYRCLNPGDVVALSHYRVKRSFEAESQDIGTVAARHLLIESLVSTLIHQNQVCRSQTR